ncbi:MAG: SDR family oxidoreductase [Myxococcales bacterium]
MKALITGGAGFIGSHIAQRLLEAGCEVVAYDNLSSGKRDNLKGLDVELVEADIRDRSRLDVAMAGVDMVFHEAAIVSVPYSVEHPEQTHDVNIAGTLNVLQAARKAGVRRVVFACSAAVYGEEPSLPKREVMAPEPVSPYGIEKITGEYYMQVFSKLYGIEAVSLRYFNVFGPRQDPRSPYSGVISVFVERALRGERATVFGDGLQSRDFVYVANVAEANWLAATKAGIGGRAYNIGCGVRTTLNDLLAMLGRVLGHPVDATYAATRTGDIRDSVADIGRAREELGYEPRVKVEEGLERLLEFVRGR